MIVRFFDVDIEKVLQQIKWWQDRHLDYYDKNRLRVQAIDGRDYLAGYSANLNPLGFFPKGYEASEIEKVHRWCTSSGNICEIIPTMMGREVLYIGRRHALPWMILEDFVTLLKNCEYEYIATRREDLRPTETSA